MTDGCSARQAEYLTTSTHKWSPATTGPAWAGYGGASDRRGSRYKKETDVDLLGLLNSTLTTPTLAWRWATDLLMPHWMFC